MSRSDFVALRPLPLSGESHTPTGLLSASEPELQVPRQQERVENVIL